MRCLNLDHKNPARFKKLQANGKMKNQYMGHDNDHPAKFIFQPGLEGIRGLPSVM